MCSCLTSFPGFFRHHLPLLRSIACLLSSTFKGLHLSKYQTRSSKPSTIKRLATKDIGISLGSRIDGRGHFLNSATLFASDQQSSSQPESNLKSLTNAAEPSATRREYYEEMIEIQKPPMGQPPQPNYPPTQETPSYFPVGDAELGLTTRKASASEDRQSCEGNQGGSSKVGRWKMPWRSDAARTGYWDVLSIFRTGGARSTMND